MTPDAPNSGRALGNADAVARGIVLTVAYGDIFDHCLGSAEIARYLPGVAVTAAEVETAADALPTISRRDGYLVLAGREELTATRRRRAGEAARLWPLAARYGRFLGRLPFVRTVLVSGALAVDSVEQGADIDLLILARGGRVWTCRALVTGVARLASRWGVELCPNWVLSEDSLALPEQSFFAARDLTQAVPVWGRSGYDRLRAANPWVDLLLPNASGPPRQLTTAGDRAGLIARAVERILSGRLGDSVERTASRWQRRHLEAKIARRQLSRGEADFSDDGYKGHFDGHAGRVSEAFSKRLAGLGVPPP